MIEGSGSGSRAGSGYIPLTSGSGSRKPKNMWIRIRIRNTAWRYRLLPPPRCSRRTYPRIQTPPPAESPVSRGGKMAAKERLKGIVPRDGFSSFRWHVWLVLGLNRGRGNFLYFLGALISVADPGCLSRIPDLGSRISDPGSKNSNKREGWKKN